jgi:hypothetical protein
MTDIMHVAKAQKTVHGLHMAHNDPDSKKAAPKTDSLDIEWQPSDRTPQTPIPVAPMTD